MNVTSMNTTNTNAMNMNTMNTNTTNTNATNTDVSNTINMTERSTNMMRGTSMPNLRLVTSNLNPYARTFVHQQERQVIPAKKARPNENEVPTMTRTSMDTACALLEMYDKYKNMRAEVNKNTTKAQSTIVAVLEELKSDLVIEQSKYEQEFV